MSARPVIPELVAGRRRPQLTVDERVLAAVRLDPTWVLRFGGLSPDPWQHALLRARARQIILLASRQVGKSTTVAALAVATALAGGTVVVMAASREQAGLLARTARRLLRALPLPPKSIIGDAAMSITLSSGGRIIAVPATDTARGHAAALVIIDEAAFVPEEAVQAIRPAIVATRGRLVLLSSAGVTGSWMHRIWEGEEDTEEHRWTRFEVPWWESRLAEDPEAVELQRRGMSPARFAQEFECVWASATGALWQPDQLAAVFADDWEVG